MRAVIQYIAERADVFSERPLFVYLRDSKVDPRERLRFIPYTAHFVMTFADLYRFVLVESDPNDRNKELVNIHLSEEANHWKWFLVDLAQMNLDPSMRFSDSLRFLWNDATSKARMWSYRLCQMSAGMTSIQKLVMVQAVEATGGVSLAAVKPAGSEYEARYGRRLVYFASHHLETEQKHTLERPDVKESLEAIELAEGDRFGLRHIVDEVFRHSDAFVDEVYALLQSGNLFEEIASGKGSY